MSRSVLIALAAAGASFAGFLALQPAASVPGRPPVAGGNTQSGGSRSSAPLASTRAAAAPPKRAEATALLNRLPARFEKIDGATPDDVSFIARGYGRQLLLTCDRAVLAPRTGAAADVTMHVEGASPCLASGERELPGRTNYLIGDDASQWRTDVRSYERASFAQVYPGIDLVYYGTGDHLEYDFVVSPGADPSAIALRFAGTDRVEIDADGALVLHAAGGELRQHAPAVYQQIDGEQRRVEGRYVMRDATRVGFELGAYDRSAPLTIDPVLVYSSYLGAAEGDTGSDVTLDSSGNIYLLGQTSSIAFPTKDPYQPARAGSPGSNSIDAFIVKLDPSGTQLLYATYFGGDSDEYVGSIAVDAAGNIFVSGYTQSFTFPSAPGSYVFGSATGAAFFVAKFAAGGASLSYLARIAAYSDAYSDATDLTIDAAGQAYVVTTTQSALLPTPGGAQPACAGSTSGSFCSASDAYLFKLNAAGSALMYATYLGGTSHDAGFGVAIDGAGFAYVVGQTNSTNFPVVSAFQPASGGQADAFLTVVSPDGGAFTNSTYLGGSNYDYAMDVAVHTDGSVVIVGSTSSSNFPVLNPAQPSGSGTAFVTRFDATLTHLVFSTYLGTTSNHDYANGVAFDAAGGVYVGGESSGCAFPSQRAYPVFPSQACGYPHPFVASYSAAGAIRHSMALSGEYVDGGSGMTLGPDKTIYLIGRSSSRTFPTVNAFQSANASPPGSFVGADAILMKFATALAVSGANPGTVRVAGGESIDIAGLNFLSGATVQFGGGPAAAPTFVSPVLLRAIVPAHAAGPVSITVNNPDGESVTRPNALLYSACTFSLSSSDVTYSLSGGIGAVDLHNDDGPCNWAAGSSDLWLRVTSATSGIGNAHLTFAVDPDSGAARSGTLTIAGRTFTVLQSGSPRRTRGDFTGEGQADLATFRTVDGRWTLNGQPDVTFGAAGDVAVPADYNGDGITDRAVYRPSSGQWIIQGLGTIGYGLPGDVPVPGDYDGDRVTDVAVFRPSAGRWFIRGQSAVDWGRPGDLAVPADYNGDGRTDVAVFRPATGDWWIAGSGAAVTWGAGGDIPVPADYNGDGRVDIAVFRPSNGTWYVRDQFARGYGIAGDVPVPLDYDGDGRADVGVYRPASGLWFIDGRGAGVSIGAPGDVPAFFRFDAQLRATPDLDRDRLADVVLSQGSTWKLVRSAGGRSIASMTFGVETDVRRIADFDGDGRADLVLFRAGTGLWYVALSSTGYSSYTVAGPWGTTGDVAVPADYDGDGRADRAVFRPSLGRWYITRSSDNVNVTTDWGLSGDTAMAEDADGDGLADLIVFRPSTGRWYIRRSIDGGMSILDWGLAGDIAAPADFDGDGRTDIAVFRPSTGAWWILGSASGYTTYTTMDYGLNGDVPAPADYNGDGRADVAVFRPSTGQFFAVPTGLLFTASPGDAIVKHQ